MPLNRYDSILVTIASSKRYFVYNYVTGEISKEIVPLRGSNFKVCSDWMFDIEKTPYITMYNSSSIRRVDINTFEIKKNIDLQRINNSASTVPKFPIISSSIPKNNYYWSNKTPNQRFKSPISL